MISKKYGIITNRKARCVFEEINKRLLCEECRKERYSLDAEIEEKDKKGNNQTSNLIPGFSSESIKIPLDLLIIGEAHGGGRSEDFRSQWSLKKEIEYIANYYLEETLIKFHQKEMRILFEWLDEQKIEYVFTDLVKCYIWRKNKKNFEIAIKRCNSYLMKQIKLLQPRIVLALGGNVQRNMRKLHFQSNQQHILPSMFPSMWTAGKWVETKGWEPVKKQIETIIKQN